MMLHGTLLSVSLSLTHTQQALGCFCSSHLYHSARPVTTSNQPGRTEPLSSVRSIKERKMEVMKEHGEGACQLQTVFFWGQHLAMLLPDPKLPL